MQNQETSALHGGCHCGAVKFTIQADVRGLMACNCSICSKVGWLMTFVPAAAFTLHTQDDALGDYQFGKHHTHHQFCKTCGIRAFSWGSAEDGSRMYCVNVRCLEGVDVAGLPVEHYDGASL